MPKPHKWQFKSRFRREAYGWNGTALASKRLKEAISEIKKVGKSDPVLAGEGAVALMERLWPALEHIDTSSGALGNSVYGTLHALIPILINAPADKKTRKKWLNRLYNAVIDDGVDYLSPVQENWGRICNFPDLINEWADMLLPTLRDLWREDKPFQLMVGIDICLSCLLETKRYEELEGILKLHKIDFWSHDKYYAEALKRQGKTDEAIAYAESRIKEEYSKLSIMEFCENILLEAGRKDEAYEQYCLYIRNESTYISQFRSIVRKYPERAPRQILIDLINKAGNKAGWFASARQFGFLDIALDCALSGVVNHNTLLRAARDTAESEPEFAAHIALRAISNLLEGHGYEMTALDMTEAFKHFIKAAKNYHSIFWAINEIEKVIYRDNYEYNKKFYDILFSLLGQVRQ